MEHPFIFFFAHITSLSPAWRLPAWACLSALCLVGRMVLCAPGKLEIVDQKHNHRSLEGDVRWKAESSA